MNRHMDVSADVRLRETEIELKQNPLVGHILPGTRCVIANEGRRSKEKDMNIENKTVLITGANQGVGRALVHEALRRSAKRVYAGTRTTLQHPDQQRWPGHSMSLGRRTRRGRC
jgi:hypothetical protein